MKASGHLWNLPNKLTIFRVLLIPVIAALLLFPQESTSLAAAALFALGALTDMLDGYLARRGGVVTDFGKFLDPLADKLLIVVPLVMLIPLRGIPAWMVAIIVGREIAVTGLRGLGAAEKMIISASSLGKNKTAYQFVAILGLILHYKFLSINFHVVGMVFLSISVVLTVWSGIDYFRKFLMQLV